jgi:hypothetical protein
MGFTPANKMLSQSGRVYLPVRRTNKMLRTMDGVGMRPDELFYDFTEYAVNVLLINYASLFGRIGTGGNAMKRPF